MKVGIICAGDRELAPFLPELDQHRMAEKAMLTFHEGKINGVDVVALFSGVCKVNAAIAAQILIDTFGVKLVINAGTAGGMNEALQLFDIVISAEAVYHDVAPHILTDFHPWMKSPSFPADPLLLECSRKAVAGLGWSEKVFWGRMATGEAFITDDGRADINSRLAPLSVDMETASIAHVCHVNGIPFLSVRCITDTADHSGTGFFEENCPKASIIAKDVALALLNEMHRAGAASAKERERDSDRT